MSDDATPRLSLPYLAAGQAQKHVTLNEALSRLDGLIQTAVESRAVDAQPASPDDGALYIMTAAASGADWAGKAEGAVMRFEAGAWAQLTVADGHVAYIKDEGVIVFWDGAAWTLFTSAIDALQDLSLLGVNATADAGNKLSVSSAAVLFNHAGAGSQVKVNKAAAGDTASHLFQTGFSGRAEFGLTGSDDFTVKVSPDGSAWHDAFTVERSSGRATFALSALRASQVDVFTASGTYTVPDWARRLKVVCVAAGGGGGGGAAGTNAANRSGGAGGGAGGRSEEEYDVAELASSLTVTIGAGGAAGASVTGTSNGGAGGLGGDTTVASSGTVILRAEGGLGGGGGATSTVTGPLGGVGMIRGSGGGSGTVGTGFQGEELTFTPGPAGGGGGGGVNTAGATGGGGRGGYGYYTGRSGRWAVGGSGGAAGAVGAAGADKAWERGCGAGAGGGGGSASANGGTGGAGGAPGGGGGGGGACRDTFNSGAGGAGGRGEVWIVAIG